MKYLPWLYLSVLAMLDVLLFNGLLGFLLNTNSSLLVALSIPAVAATVIGNIIAIGHVSNLLKIESIRNENVD